METIITKKGWLTRSDSDAINFHEKEPYCVKSKHYDSRTPDEVRTEISWFSGCSIWVQFDYDHKLPVTVEKPVKASYELKVES